MDELIEKLEEFGKEKFISKYRHELCSKTVNQTKVAAALHFDFDQSAIINHPTDHFSKCEKLYELIHKKSKVKDFLETLDKTGNEHIIEFIQSTLTQQPLTSGQIPATKSVGLWFNIPEPIESFCGREHFLTQLHDKLQHRDNSIREVTVLSQVKIVSGLGGIGKTETARRYISQYFEFYNNFIWINAENENSLTNSFIKLAEEIQISAKDSEGKSREIQEIVKEIYNKITEGGKSNLIVFDNAEDYQSCKRFFPPSLHPNLKRPVILATSRYQEWISPTGKIQVLPLDVLTNEESLEFILKQLEISDTEEFREESKEFIELIGGLPLALQQAVAFTKQEKEERKFLEKTYKMSDYVQEFKLSMKKFLSFSPVPAPDSSPTVFVTWNVTFEKIQKLVNGKDAVKMLEILSFLYADKIPSSFLHDLVPEIKDGEFSGALKLLNKYSLIKMDSRDFCLSIHRQLQFVILQYLKECDDVSNVVMNIVDKCTVVLENIKLSESSDIFLNVHQIVKNQFDLIPMTAKFLDFMYEFGSVLSGASRFSESLDLNKKLYKERRESLGQNHPKTLASQDQVALQLKKLGKYDEAFTLYKETLEQEEIHLGVDHPDTITTKHNMANLLRYQEKYGESLELFQQVLDQKNKIHGENNPKTLSTQNGIAVVHSELGDFSTALTLFEQLEKKQMEVLGPDHRQVFQTQKNKAVVLFKMGKTKEASKIFQEVLEKRKEILGENHSSTINTLRWTAVILEGAGKLTEALDIFRRVYEMRKTNLGENHPHTIQVKSNVVNIENRL